MPCNNSSCCCCLRNDHRSTVTMMATPWERISEDAYKQWLENRQVIAEEFNSWSFDQRSQARTQFEQCDRAGRRILEMDPLSTDFEKHVSPVMHLSQTVNRPSRTGSKWKSGSGGPADSGGWQASRLHYGFARPACVPTPPRFAVLAARREHRAAHRLTADGLTQPCDLRVAC